MKQMGKLQGGQSNVGKFRTNAPLLPDAMNPIGLSMQSEQSHSLGHAVGWKTIPI